MEILNKKILLDNKQIYSWDNKKFQDRILEIINIRFKNQT